MTTGSCSIAPNTTLNGSPGVHATTSAQITTNNVNVNETNGGSTGGLAETNGTIIFSAGSSINGNWSTAASAQTGGQIIFQPGSAINPSFGGGVTALLASGVNGAQASQIVATGLNVNLNGNGGNTGARATNGGVIMLNGGTAITFAAGGGGNTGLSASGTGSQIITNGATLTMAGGGGGDTGVRADTGAAVTLNGGAVTVQSNGGGETGLLASGAGSSIGGTNVVVNVTNSGGGRGAFLQNGATIDLSGGSLTTSGPGTFGFLLQAPAATTNTLRLSGTEVSSAADAFAVQGGTANITVTDGSKIIGNNGILLSANQNGGAPAVVTMLADASTLTGAIQTDSVSTSNVTLTGNTTWNMTGNSTVTSLTNNASSIVFSPPSGDPTQLASYRTLTATNYTGTGGRITLNTFLGTDGSPSDQLIIKGGAASGMTSLLIRNTAGPGQETIGNGILVVNTINGGTTMPGAFMLGGEVRAGDVDYDLFRGGLNGGSPNSWFLRSTFVVPPEPIEPPIEPPTNPDPPPDPLPPGVYPIIGPELATYGVVQPIARQLGLATLGTLHQRIGDTLLDDNGTPNSTGWNRSMWGRFFGQQIDNHYQAFADPRAQGWIGGFQGGVDIWRGSLTAGHVDAAGIYVANGVTNVGVNGLVTNPSATGYVLTHTGSVNLDAFSAGTYWTHYGPSGWYVDAVLQGTLYTGSATTQFANLPAKGGGFVASLEAGYPIALPLGPRFVLEPQAQIIWQQVGFSQANDGEGMVALGWTAGATGRIGLRGQWTIVSADGQVWQPYLRANLWRDWGAEATTTFGSDPVLLIEQVTRLELAGGVTAKLSNHMSLYGQAGYQFVPNEANHGTRRDGINGDVGVRYAW